MLKQKKFADKTVKSTQLSLVLVGLHDFQIFPDHTAHAWSVEVGNICSVSVFFVRVSSQISLHQEKKDSNIPTPGRTRSGKCPTPGPTKTIKSPPHAHGHEPLACYLFGVKWSLYHVQFGLFYRFNPYFANLKLQLPCNFNKSIMQMNKNTENFVNPFNSICTCLFKSRHGRDSTDPWTGWTHSYNR